LHLAGTIDDVRIYDRALSTEEIEELYQAGQGLVAHWKFDEGAGGIAYDSAGDNDGTLVNGPVWTSGILDGALNFDGLDDYVDVADDPSLRFSQYDSFTLSLWTAPAEGGWILSKMRAAEQWGVFGYESAWSDSASAFSFIIDRSWYYSTTVTTGEGSAPAGDWYHVTAVYDNKDMKIYLNGALGGSGSFGGGTGSTTPDKNLAIGTRSYDSIMTAFYSGDLDDVRIYGRALSAEEIRQLYEEGLPEPPRVFYVDGVNGSDLNDGLSLETAFATIQKGIDEANDADTVLVYPAVYTETTDFKGKAIALQGVATSAGVPIIEAPGDLAVSFYTAEEANSVLQNFVIRNSFRGVFIAGAAPTIGNLIVVDNDLGIVAYAGAEPNISNCIFWNNTDGDLFQCEARYSWTQEGLGTVAEGLISYWQFDEGSGTTAYDWVGTNDGTIYGATWTTGVLGGALDFDGVDDYVMIPDDDSLTPSDAITIAFWYYTRDGQYSGIHKWASCPSEPSSPGNSRAYHLELQPDDNRMDFKVHSSVNVYDIISTNTSILSDQWYHIVGTFHQGNAGMYINGQLDNYETMSVSSIMNDAQPLMIGAQWRYCDTDRLVDKLNGMIDDVRIYDRALSAEEVQDVFEYAPGPLFADAAGGDYHLKSERGRYWPAHDVWVLDDVTSPGVDGGDPSIYPGEEPMPNGGRINMGAYGGTAYASMSEWPIEEDNNRDGIVNFLDFANLAARWLERLDWYELPPEDTTPPTPDPMRWDETPDGNGFDGRPREVLVGPDPMWDWGATMRADPETSDVSGFEFYFECVDEPGFTSDWISFSGPPYIYTVKTGQKGLLLKFRVKARDLSANRNETAWSEVVQMSPSP
jgi:hypothetical protein